MALRCGRDGIAVADDAERRRAEAGEPPGKRTIANARGAEGVQGDGRRRRERGRRFAGRAIASAIASGNTVVVGTTSAAAVFSVGNNHNFESIGIGIDILAAAAAADATLDAHAHILIWMVPVRGRGWQKVATGVM